MIIEGTSAERARRCLLAGAVGDAWGGAYEGGPPVVVPAFPTNAMLSDDTQLTLATCEELTASRGRVDPAQLAERFRLWFAEGRLVGLGSATLKAMRDLNCGAHWALAGARGEFAAGAGAAMRVAPLAFVINLEAPYARQSVRDVCRITHHNDEAYAGALAMVVGLRLCTVASAVPHDLIASVADALPDTAVRDRLEQLATIKDPPSVVAARVGSTGHVVDAVPLALYIATRVPGSVADVVRTAVAVGGDTDTIAALAAQLVGAAGAEVPESLWRQIHGSEALAEVIDAFVRQLW